MLERYTYNSDYFSLFVMNIWWKTDRNKWFNIWIPLKSNTFIWAQSAGNQRRYIYSQVGTSVTSSVKLQKKISYIVVYFFIIMSHWHLYSLDIYYISVSYMGTIKKNIILNISFVP